MPHRRSIDEVHKELQSAPLVVSHPSLPRSTIDALERRIATLEQILGRIADAITETK